MSAKPCATCDKPCYPTEKVVVSELWVHKHSCLKCSVCFTTLSLSSAYVAAPPNTSTNPAQSERMLYCAKDVPKKVHTSVVDSVALQAALHAPSPMTTPQGVFIDRHRGGSARSIRFKGLTLRSKSIHAGLNAPKLDVQHRTRFVIGHAGGAPLDPWDVIALATPGTDDVDTDTDRPRRPLHRPPTPAFALVPDPTGSTTTTTTDASGPGSGPGSVLVDNQTNGHLAPPNAGTGLGDGDDVARESKGEKEAIDVEPDLVKNLIKVFQLDTVDRVELAPLAPLAPAASTASDASAALTAPTLDLDSTGLAAGLTLTNVGTLGTLSRRPRASPTPLADLFAKEPTTFASTSPPEAGRSQVVVEAAKADGERARRLLESLLPFAAHMIPLPNDDGGLEENVEAKDGKEGDKTEDEESKKAREQLVMGLEENGLELIMLFEEDPEPVEVE